MCSVVRSSKFESEMIPARGPQTHFQQVLRAKHLLTMSVFQFDSWAQVPLGTLGPQAAMANPDAQAIGSWA